MASGHHGTTTNTFLSTPTKTPSDKSASGMSRKHPHPNSNPPIPPPPPLLAPLASRPTTVSRRRPWLSDRNSRSQRSWPWEVNWTERAHS
ncbi:hypothetical protein CJ030_MR1G003368 [Morella rubra]|uniref:Uncharacterized protein n=1 Tax=Morella rubra TaxID=262757 RepID=A0A6A1WS19_9ROSI|nr:hypothetical protein CJ030_MR1G003368 [Morella rubra]